MNGMMHEAAKNMPHVMSSASPIAQGAVMAATGYAAGRGLLGGALLRNPLVLLAAGVVVGYYLHKHQNQIMLALSKASGMGKDFMLQQKESLADLVEEAKEKEGQQAMAATGKPEQPAA
jgi:hypothetical protein